MLKNQFSLHLEISLFLTGMSDVKFHLLLVYVLKNLAGKNCRTIHLKVTVFGEHKVFQPKKITERLCRKKVVLPPSYWLIQSK